MKLSDLLSRMTDGAVKIILFDSSNGVVILSTIWHNLIPGKFFDYEVESIEIRDYEMRIGIHDWYRN